MAFTFDTIYKRMCDELHLKLVDLPPLDSEQAVREVAPRVYTLFRESYCGGWRSETLQLYDIGGKLEDAVRFTWGDVGVDNVAESVFGTRYEEMQSKQLVNLLHDKGGNSMEHASLTCPAMYMITEHHGRSKSRGGIDASRFEYEELAFNQFIFSPDFEEAWDNFPAEDTDDKNKLRGHVMIYLSDAARDNVIRKYWKSHIRFAERYCERQNAAKRQRME